MMRRCHSTVKGKRGRGPVALYFDGFDGGSDGAGVGVAEPGGCLAFIFVPVFVPVILSDPLDACASGLYCAHDDVCRRPLAAGEPCTRTRNAAPRRARPRALAVPSSASAPAVYGISAKQ